MVLRPIHPDANDTSAKSIAHTKGYLGAKVWVRWPHLLEAHVVGVSSQQEKCFVSAAAGGVPVNTTHAGRDKTQFTHQVQELRQKFRFSRGLEIGQVHILLHVRVSQGYTDKFTARGTVTRERVWSKRESTYPLQLCLKDLAVHHDEDNVAEVPMSERLDVGSSFCFLGMPHYGALGEVKAVDDAKARVTVELQVALPPQVHDLLGAVTRPHFHDLNTAAHRLQMSPNLLNRLAGDLFCYSGSPKSPGEKQNLGLRLKYNKRNQEVPGMSQRAANGQWQLSDAALALVARYRTEFPQLFLALAQAGSQDDYYAELLFHTSPLKHFKEIKAFLKEELKVGQWETVPCGTQTIPRAAIHKLEERLEAAVARLPLRITIRGVYPKFLLLQHTVLRDGLGQAPDPDATHELGDRVVWLLWGDFMMGDGALGSQDEKPREPS
jgi:hypothetical protein